MAAARRSGRLTIFVRFNSNTNIPVTIDPQWTVLRLKQEIATNQGVEASELRIIFAGRELKDDLQLKVCFTVYSVNITLLLGRFARVFNSTNCIHDFYHFSSGLVLTSVKIVCLIPWNEQLLIVFLYIYVLNQL